MITVKRYDHPNNYECYYFVDGKEMAWYCSKDDVVYLRSDFLARPFSLPYADRMAKSKYSGAWASLVDFLRIDENTRLSEYSNL